jgi:hypothetical protein
VARARRVAQVAPSPVAQPKNGGLMLMILISIVFVGFAAAYNYMTPLTTPTWLHQRDGGAANPDEPAHLLYVSTVASGHLPVFSPSNADYEAAQPPLYYAIAAVVYKLSPDNAVVRAHNVRWVATAFGLAFVWITFYSVRLKLEDERIATMAAMLVALLPMQLSLSASVGNDSATNLVFGLFLYQSFVALRSSERLNYNFVLVGVLLALGLWTKSSTLILLPVLAIGLIAAWVNKKLTGADSARGFVISMVITAALFSPWMIRNQHLYGDVFARRVVFQQLASRNFAPSSLIAAEGWIWYLTTFITWTFESFWGVFDSMTLFLAPQVYMVLATASAAALISGFLLLIKRKMASGLRAKFGVWAGLVVLTAVAYLQYNVHFFQLQGRYLFPALVPLAAVAAYGITKISTQRYVVIVHYGCLIGLVLLNILCLTMISGRYSL